MKNLRILTKRDASLSGFFTAFPLMGGDMIEEVKQASAISFGMGRCVSMLLPDRQRLQSIADYCSEIEKTVLRYGNTFSVFE